MRLKSLDIKGFKSFADKTQVLLDNAVTGIVGPNGCGKSNIVDAIRWVIGEQKIKSLRSDSLEDLVFNGSKSRSAAGMAEVSLTFENTRNLLPTEFSTVTVTRKFFKNGDSEYRLNDVICRLKDIRNLFLDTGVSNDSYAIIELAMVDDIIKDKEGSRRRMLEQAAGISIYKTRKKEAQHKLETTQQDIDRIEDLLFEIGNNMRTLESQARKAERYLKIKAQYKDISLDLARVTLASFNDRYQSLNRQLAQEEDRRLKAAAAIADDEAQIESDKAKLATEEQELAAAQKQFNDLVNRIRNLENEKKLSTQHLRHLQEREQGLKAAIAGADEQMKQLSNRQTQSEQQAREIQTGYEDLEKSFTSLRADADKKRQRFDEQKRLLEEKRKALQEVQTKQFAEEKKSAVADNTLANLRRDLNRIGEELGKRKLALERLYGEKVTLENHVKVKEKLATSLREEQGAVEENIQRLQDAIEKLREQELTANRQLDARQNEHDLLKSLVDNLEGYPESIKFLGKNKEWSERAPLLSDVFSVSEDYRVALESVLDQYLNYYVVSEMSEAMAAVALLEKNKKGKANFFLLNHLKHKTALSSECPTGFLRAIDLVETEKKYQTLAEHLLSSVLIAEDSELLNETALPNGFIYVSKDGRILRRDYTLKGGSVGAFEGNKIGRAKNLSVLTKTIETLSAEVSEVRQKKERLQAELKNDRETLKSIDVNAAQRDLNQAQNGLMNATTRIEQLTKLNEDADLQARKIEEQITAHQENFAGQSELLKAISSELSELKSAMEAISKVYVETEQAFNAATKAYNEQEILLTRQRSRLDQLQQEQRFRQERMNELQQQLKSNKTQLEETSEQISATSGKLNFGDNELEELVAQKDKDSKALNERDRAYYVFRNEVREHEQRISQQRKEKEQAETLVNTLREQLSNMKVEVAGIKERLQVEFKVQLEDILAQEPVTDLDLETLNEESEKLQKRLNNMGEVNPTAVEAFQEIKLRYDFIQEQRADLEQARDSLLATIEEVEQTANNRFKETFDKVRENFIQVFKALFTEDDTADLTLTNPDNLAESNIEIYARPKGKRPSTLTQLSGGEKTLTSTAYLFAIYLIKPAPFCILDEVDAPLDDANVGKFTGMIRKFSDHSQFIIITHNKETMASVDVIYGVTMQEVGVSKIVPVDFRNLN